MGVSGSGSGCAASAPPAGRMGRALSGHGVPGKGGPRGGEAARRPVPAGHHSSGAACTPRVPGVTPKARQARVRLPLWHSAAPGVARPCPRCGLPCPGAHRCNACVRMPGGSAAADSATPRTVAPRILQTRRLEWATISSSRGPSRPRDQTHLSSPALESGFFTTGATWEAHEMPPKPWALGPRRHTQATQLLARTLKGLSCHTPPPTPGP